MAPCILFIAVIKITTKAIYEQSAQWSLWIQRVRAHDSGVEAWDQQQLRTHKFVFYLLFLIFEIIITTFIQTVPYTLPYSSNSWLLISLFLPASACMRVRVHTHPPGYNLLHPYNVSCIYVFRALPWAMPGKQQVAVEVPGISHLKRIL